MFSTSVKNKIQQLNPNSHQRQASRRYSKKSLSMTSITSYFGVFLLIATLVAVSYGPSVKSPLAQASPTIDQTKSKASSQPIDTSIDKLTAMNVATAVSESSSMPIANNIANLSQSLTVENMIAKTDTDVISKPQNNQLASDNRTASRYTTVQGDTIPSVAEKYGLSPQTIKWANNITSDAVEPGKELTIPAIDGVVYTVKDGDTVDSIAEKYKADKSRLVAYNDLELTNTLAGGTQITIPGGDMPTNERPGYVAPRQQQAQSFSGINYGSYSGGVGSLWRGGASAGNRYSYGQCTWYVYERRAQLGMPVGGMWGNANTWAYAASASGYLVDGNPTVGSIMQNGGGYGHVAVVESVNPGVSITISEMNGYRFGGGWNRVGTGDISWAEAVSGMYRYIH